jgi:hypothetical protein
LFRVYLGSTEFDNIKLKIFLRNDIWRRITESGFREASHITKHVTIDWDRSSLVNLMVRRLVHNQRLLDHYGVAANKVLATLQNQEDFFYRLFPDQVDTGKNKPSTIDWIISRTKDGTLKTAPREVIHLLNTLRARQVQRFELGQPEPDGEDLFDRQSFKEALPEVSSVRLTQTLYAEYPGFRGQLETLRGAKASQTLDSLTAIWKLPHGETQRLADQLVEVGFFERRGKDDTMEFWVPFLYRDALELIQGSAD